MNTNVRKYAMIKMVASGGLLGAIMLMWGSDSPSNVAPPYRLMVNY